MDFFIVSLLVGIFQLVHSDNIISQRGSNRALEDGYCDDNNKCDVTTSKCVEQTHGYKCECLNGYEPCENGISNCCEKYNWCRPGRHTCPQQMSTCVPLLDGDYTCKCHSAYKRCDNGDHKCCEVRDICKEDKPCNETTASCINGSLPGEFECRCKAGYRHPVSNNIICLDINECIEQTDSCDVSTSTCVNLPGSYECQCRAGYHHPNANDNKTCLDINECIEQTDSCDVSTSTCVNLPGSYECQCLAGFHHPNANDNKTCQDIDECAETKPCDLTNSVCMNLPGSFECQCRDGYRHPVPDNKVICEDIDECSDMKPNPCEKIIMDETAQQLFPISIDQNVVCINKPGTYQCPCNVGFQHPTSTMTYCIDINECLERPCDEKNSACRNIRGDYACDCYWGFTNLEPPDEKLCRDIDECNEGVNSDSKVVACNDVAAMCVNLEGSYECECFQGYQHVVAPGSLLLGCQDCCVDIDECALQISACSDICAEGLAPPPTNYTCSCFPDRFLSTPIQCENCFFTDWSLWGPCNVTCGLGAANRTREPLIGGGASFSQCEAPEVLITFLPCMKPPCPSSECQLSPWANWSACNVTQGSGYQTQTRIVIANGENCRGEIMERFQRCYVEAETVDWLSKINVTSVVAGGGIAALICIGVSIVAWQYFKNRRRSNEVHM